MMLFSRETSLWLEVLYIPRMICESGTKSVLLEQRLRTLNIFQNVFQMTEVTATLDSLT